MSPLRFTFPLPPNLANRRQHWGRRKAYYKQLDELQNCGLLPPPPFVPITNAVVGMTLYLGAAMDDANALHRGKWPIDWLVTRGYLAGDSRKHIQWQGFPRQVVHRLADKAYTIAITVTPLDALPARL